MCPCVLCGTALLGVLHYPINHGQAGMVLPENIVRLATLVNGSAAADAAAACLCPPAGANVARSGLGRRSVVNMFAQRYGDVHVVNILRGGLCVNEIHYCNGIVMRNVRS